VSNVRRFLVAALVVMSTLTPVAPAAASAGPRHAVHVTTGGRTRPAAVPRHAGPAGRVPLGVAAVGGAALLTVVIVARRVTQRNPRTATSFRIALKP